MTALLSIKPEFASLIFEGSKRFEYRRTIFRRDVTRVVVYASAPVSMVIGEFEVEGVLSDDIDDLWRTTKHASGITEQYFYGYFTAKETGYALQIGAARLYDTPLSIQEHYGVRPPQSFLYL